MGLPQFNIATDFFLAHNSQEEKYIRNWRMNMMHTNIANDSRKPCLMDLYDIKNKVNKLSDKEAIK